MPNPSRPEKLPPPDPDASRYELYGITLESDFSFSYHLAPGHAPGDLYFGCCPEDADPDFWEGTACVYATRAPNGDRSGLYRKADREALRFLDGAADFHLGPERITCHLRDPAYEYGVEVWLLGTVLAYWMERRGVPMLHAAAASVEGRAIAFLATNRGGKSSLAATLMQAGHPLLTDDLLPIDVEEETPRGRPGYPQMRLWPDQAAHFTGGSEDLARVVPHLDKRRVPVGPGGWGAFCGTAQPLAGFYLPERRAPEAADTSITIEPLSRQEALIELVRHAFLPNLVEAAGLQPQRLARLAQVARRVPVQRLTYPSGLDHLPRVCEALLSDADVN